MAAASLTTKFTTVGQGLSLSAHRLETICYPLSAFLETPNANESERSMLEDLKNNGKVTGHNGT